MSIQLRSSLVHLNILMTLVVGCQKDKDAEIEASITTDTPTGVVSSEQPTTDPSSGGTVTPEPNVEPDDGKRDVTAQTDSHLQISPATKIIIATNAVAKFTLAAATGYSVAPEVGGTCPLGSWNGLEYSTGAVTDDCNVVFSSYLNWVGIRAVGAAAANTRADKVAVDGKGNVYVTSSTSVGLSGATQTGTIDAYIAKYDRSGAVVWHKQLGATGVETSGNDIAVNAAGDVFLVGVTQTNLDGNILNGVKDGFLAKFASNGSLKWVRQMGAAAAETHVNSIALDSLGNIFIAGATQAGLNGKTQAGYWDSFTAKYDPAGTLTWYDQLGGNGGGTFGTDIAADSMGNVYFVAHGDVGVAGNTLIGYFDTIAGKYDADGNLAWLNQIGGANGSSPVSGLGLDAAETSIYVVGNTDVSFGGSSTQLGSEDTYIIKFSSAGATIYSKRFAVAGKIMASRGLLMDQTGNPVIVGITNAGLDGNILTGNYDGFVATFDDDAELVWAKQYGGAGGEAWALGAAIDKAGNFFVVGASDRDTLGHTLIGSRDYLLLKYDASGDLY